MASSGKKGKKTKGKTVALNEFLANKADEPEPTKPWTKLNWADEDVDDDFSHRSKDKHVVLPTAPRATREPGVIDETRLPNEAPFIAYISNLPYDVDNEDIAEFFKGLEIKGLRLPRDEGREGSKLKGFGYVEFEDRESLKEALHFANRDIKGRSVGVEVADGGDDRYRRGGMGRDIRRSGIGRDMDGPDRTLGDWRSGPREEDREQERERGGFGFRDRGGGSRRDFGGGFRERDGGGFREREGGGGFRERDGGGFREREGGGGFRERDAGGFREREGGGGFRERDGGGFRDRDGSSGFSDRWGGDRADRGDRDLMRREGGDSSRREGGFVRRGFDDKEEGAPEKGGEAGRTRPKLQLAPRTRAPEEKKPEVAPVVAQSSIFGGAKPVDTAAREREIEERLARERGSSDAAVSRDTESRPKGEEWEDDNKSRKDNVWVRRSQKPLDDQQQEEEERELNKEKSGSEHEYEEKELAPLPGHGSLPKDVGEKQEASSKARAQPAAIGREAARMPELVDKGPPVQMREELYHPNIGSGDAPQEGARGTIMDFLLGVVDEINTDEFTKYLAEPQIDHNLDPCDWLYAHEASTTKELCFICKLRTGVFRHRQLYAACSRVDSRRGLYELEPTGKTTLMIRELLKGSLIQFLSKTELSLHNPGKEQI